MQWYKPLDLQSKQDMKINKTNKHLTQLIAFVIYLTQPEQRSYNTAHKIEI